MFDYLLLLLQDISSIRIIIVMHVVIIVLIVVIKANLIIVMHPLIEIHSYNVFFLVFIMFHYVFELLVYFK